MVLVIVGGAGCFESYPASSACMLEQRRSCTCDTGGPGWETCYGAVPAVWGACICNSAPIADAGPDRTVSYHTTVLLDGTHSSDADGDMLQFRWTLDSLPPGSTAMLSGATNRIPSFIPDVPGDYVVSLIVNDAIVASDPARATISAQDDAPHAVATIAPYVITGAPMMLDASASTDVNFDPLAFTWSVADPAGSTAAPVDATAATTTFVPDVDGAYQVSVVVDDGRKTSMLSQPVHSYHRMTSLPFQPWRADYDKPSDLVIFISSDPTNALYAYDPTTDTIASVALPTPPNALSISPDGTRAIVGDYTGITNVNLTTMQVTNHFVTNVSTYDVVDPGDGWAYVFPASVDFEIRGVRLSTGAVTVGARAIGDDMRARRMPGTTSIYATDSLFTEVFRFSSGTTTLTTTANSIGTDLLISDDGTHVVSFGNVYAPDLTKLGQLRGYAVYSTESSATGTLLAVPGAGTSGTDDEVVDVYAYPSLTYDHSVSLPPQLRNGAPYTTHGRGVFLHADGVHYSVIVQAEPLSSPGQWAVLNM